MEFKTAKDFYHKALSEREKVKDKELEEIYLKCQHAAEDGHLSCCVPTFGYVALDYVLEELEKLGFEVADRRGQAFDFGKYANDVVISWHNGWQDIDDKPF